MADRSNYADKDASSDPPQHRVFFYSDFRAYTPSDGNSKEIYGQLAAKSSGDWSWKPERDALLRRQLKDARRIDSEAPDTFRTFAGVRPSAAELFRGLLHQPG